MYKIDSKRYIDDVRMLLILIRLVGVNDLCEGALKAKLRYITVPQSRVERAPRTPPAHHIKSNSEPILISQCTSGNSNSDCKK
jgi:hypothetical protein